MAARDDRTDKFSVLKALAAAGLTQENIKGLGQYKRGQDSAKAKYQGAINRRQATRRAGLRAIAGKDGQSQTPKGSRSIMDRASRAGSPAAAFGGDDRKSAVARRRENLKHALAAGNSRTTLQEIDDRREVDARQKRNARGQYA